MLYPVSYLVECGGLITNKGWWLGVMEYSGRCKETKYLLFPEKELANTFFFFVKSQKYHIVQLKNTKIAKSMTKLFPTIGLLNLTDSLNIWTEICDR